MEVSTIERDIVKEHADSVVETTLLVGEEVWEFLNDERIQKDWDRLFEACSWKTAFQQRKFVSNWYREYSRHYLPVVVASKTAGELTGLLTMAAIIPTSGKITPTSRLTILGAGHYRAEYQVWLASESNSVFFIKNALKLIGDRFPKSDIVLRFVPSEQQLGWVKSDPYWRRHCVVQSFQRALIKMSDPTFSKLFTKKEFKNKRNRLKRMDGFTFERIQDLEGFLKVLPDLVAQYDFRQAAMFNKTPFRDAPEMQELLVRLFKDGLLHVTVMRANNEVLASIVAVVHEKWAHLGAINTHTPFHAKNSPGFVHFIMLGQMLAEEGYEYFDLTAGGDFYKERMANYHDRVYTLLYTQNKDFRLKRLVRKFITQMLIKADIRPMSAELNLRKQLYLLKSRVKMLKDKDAVSSLVNQYLFRKKEQLLWVKDLPKTEGAAEFLPLEVDKLNDLLDFDMKGARVSQWEFLETAMENYEAGYRSYTWAERGSLMASVWVKADGCHAGEQLDGPLLTGLYCHPSGKSRLPEFLDQVTQGVRSEYRAEKIYARTSAFEKVPNIGFRKAGFIKV